jgi:hypothetical protein
MATATSPPPGYLPTRCCSCQRAFHIRPSLMMRMGINTGHVTCPGCAEFLHVEVLECEAWTERWNDWLAKQPTTF